MKATAEDIPNNELSFVYTCRLIDYVLRPLGIVDDMFIIEFDIFDYIARLRADGA